MGRVPKSFQILGGCLIALLWCAMVRAQSIPLERRVGHPSGAALVLRSLDARDDSLVLSAALANPTDRELRLNRSRSFVLSGDGRDVHRLNPPLGNPELAIPPRAEIGMELVFIGPLAATTRQLTLSTNEGIGTADNPHDDAPVFRTALPVESRVGTQGANQAGHPDGTTLRVKRLVAGRDACVVSLGATNGNDRTIVLNHAGSLVLTDERGGTASLKAPAENRELVVPSSTKLDAELVFDCRKLDASGPVTLTTNRGTAGTTDNPYDTLPVVALRLQAEAADASAMPAASRALVVPIARSQLGTVAAAPAPSARPAETPAAPPGKSPTAAPPPAAAPARAPGPDATPARKAAPRTVEELQEALQAEKTDRGLRLLVPSDALFEPTVKTLRAAGDPTLENLAALIAVMQAREVVVIAHTDSAGSDDDNLTLSEERARAVAGWLKEHAAKPPPRIVEKFYGRTRPVAPNHNADGSDNADGRTQNRLIEILIRRR